MDNVIEQGGSIESDVDRSIAAMPKDIPGWGMDADPANNPTYPMKHYTGADHQRLNYQRPPQQPVTVEVLKSIERPTITSVFGTTAPPKGISGAIRRFAFRYSESTYAHWVPLVLADRIDSVQGIVDDLKEGHIPNIFAERGWQAEWKYNRKGLIKNLVVGAVITTTVIALLKERKKG